MQIRQTDFVFPTLIAARQREFLYGGGWMSSAPPHPAKRCMAVLLLGLAVLLAAAAPAGAAPPGKPAAPTLVNRSDGSSAYLGSQLIVTWAEPADTGGSTITSYDVQYRRTEWVADGILEWTVVDPAWSAGTLTYTITELPNSAEYEVQVRAVNADGAGLWSPSAEKTVKCETGCTTDYTMSIGDAEIEEGNSGTKTLTFKVTLTEAQTDRIFFKWHTVDRTAKADSDYKKNQYKQFGDITDTDVEAGERFPAGDTSKDIEITINGDTDVEPDETFEIHLSTIALTVADGVGVGTILTETNEKPVNGGDGDGNGGDGDGSSGGGGGNGGGGSGCALTSSGTGGVDLGTLLPLMAMPLAFGFGRKGKRGRLISE